MSYKPIGNTLKDYVLDKHNKHRAAKNKKIERIKADRQFVLNEESIKALVDSQIIPSNKDLTYTINKSKTTNSYYVKFRLGDVTSTTRISDHMPRKNFKEKHGSVVNAETTKKIILELFNQRIVDLRYKYKQVSFKMFDYLQRKN